MPATHEAPAGAATLAARLRETHRELLDCVDALPESRSFRSTERDGWTLKHELAYIAAADRVLLDAVERLRTTTEPLDAPLTVAGDAVALRRLHGEAMHETQELRLDPLRDALAALSEALPQAIEQASDAITRPLALGGAPEPAIEHLRAHIERSEAGIQRLRSVLE